MKSMSQLSISQAVATKKVKHLTTETISTNQEVIHEADTHDYNLYKPSKYLRIPQTFASSFAPSTTQLSTEEEERTAFHSSST